MTQESIPNESEALLKYLYKANVTTVVLGGTDTHGVMRGKRIPIGQLERILETGMALCEVFWVMHVDESNLVQRPDGYVGYFPTESTGYPDMLGVPDLSTARMIPWHEDTVFILCDWSLPHHAAPLPLDPRNVLRQVVERGREMGFEAFSALELEFYLLKETPNSIIDRHPWELVPLQTRPSTYGVVLGSSQEPIAHQIREQMLEYGLPIEACNPETGPGQFEINLRYDHALASADHAFLFKSGVKEVAYQNDLLATFMAKPNADWAGNSCHIHLSLKDHDGTPVFYDDTMSHGISKTMSHFIAGSLNAMPEFTALLAPNPNSYRRYRKYSWAGTTATWGIDNRSAGLRVICEGSEGTRVEHRQAGGDANPYIALAAVLAAGLSGIASKLEPPKMIEGDIYAMNSNEVPQLPRSLEQAVELLDASSLAREWLGNEFVNHYVVMKRAELTAQASAVTNWDVQRYLEAL
jgi:glutamine synthetase